MEIIWQELKEKRPQEMSFIIDRITLIKNGLILREFDLVNNLTLSRIESLDNNRRYNSYLELKAKLEAKEEKFKF